MNQRPSVPARQAAPATTAGGDPSLTVGLFAGMAEAVGSREVRITWPGGTAATLRRRLAEEFPAVADLMARSAVAIGAAYVTDDATIVAGADVAIIPPVSGG